ncbi:PAS domain S-box protein [Halorussus marinus]|uniref:PAS domain S-box protein n=1 Tax=Halorussus marinus TaxID=2505976 RepID=UPI001FD671E3|nr:PAS domain S-box protein [Halorussus marinus]
MDSGGGTIAEMLGALEAIGSAGEPVTAGEIAAEFGGAREAAAERLDELVERGDAETKSVGGERVWWRSPDPEALGAARFRSLVDAVEEYAIFMLDPEGRVVTWNSGASAIKGYDEREIIGEHFSTFYTTEDVEAGVPERNLAAAAERGRTEDEGWRVRADGSRFWANIVLTAIRDDDGTLEGFAKVTRDMTERREREQRFRRERDQTRQLLKTSPVALAVRDAEGEVQLANERARELFGETGWGLDERAVPDAGGGSEAFPTARVRETGEPVSDELVPIESADGERRWLSVSAAPVFDADGGLERVIVAGEDVTDLKRRERELETELAEILGRVSDAFYALDEEFRFTHVNDRAQELLQRSESELLGERLWEVFPEAADDDDVWGSFHEAVDTQTATSYEVYFEPLDLWVEASVYPSETGVSVYFRDVSERIDRERALADSERRYRTLAENFPNGIVTLFDDDHRYTVAAGEAFDSLDLAPADVEGRTPTDVWNDETVAETIEETMDAALDGDEESIEITYAGREWVVYAVPVDREDGTVTSGMTMSLDITERKERERRLERFASVISHGLRNPLEIAQIYLDMARDDGDPGDFDQIERALDRMETIIRNLLTTSRGGQGVAATEAVAVAGVAEQAWQTVETPDATLVVGDETGSVVADADQLKTVLENLFRNAMEYGSPDAASADDAAGGATVRVGHLDDGFYVEDDGPGISPDKREEVFEYGYTSGSGTGIGLAVVRDIAEVHGWEVAATEGTDGGARFEIRGVTRPAADGGE